MNEGGLPPALKLRRTYRPSRPPSRRKRRKAGCECVMEGMQPITQSSGEPLRDPELDQRLPGDAHDLGLSIQAVNDPCREVHVDALDRDVGTLGARPVHDIRNALALMKTAVELIRL